MTRMASPAGIEVSIVVPVYGCRGCLEELHGRTSAVMRALGATWELVLVDDCDPQNSWEVAARIALADTNVRVYRLSRNFGQHAAITAGLAQCRGRWAVVMDCDLQDPPEDIPLLYAKAREGFDVVLGRRQREGHSAFRRYASRLYFSLMKAAVGTPRLEGPFGSFSIISRKVIDSLLRFQDQDRHYVFMLNWLGFATAVIEYAHRDRHSGTSSYTLRQLVGHALNGVFFQTTVLLRWIVYVGFWVSAMGFGLALWYVYQYFAHGLLPGFTSLAVLILLIGGFIIMSTGVAGIYIGKVFDQVKGRPLYVIDRSIEDGEPR